MIIIVKILDIASGFIKVLRFGKEDIVTPLVSLPYGIDSKPIKNKRGVISDTRKKGKNVILGYLLESEKTESGEIRLYATDDDGVEKFYVHLKKDGTCEIGGDVDNMVRYIPLNAGLQAEKTLINAELAKIAVAINAIVPNSYAVTPISVDISAAKIDEIKTI